MKNKFSFVIVYCWFFILLILGVLLLLFAEKEERISESEKRMLSGFPAITVESIFSGEFSAGFESFLSDGIFARDQVAGVSEKILNLFSSNTETDLALLDEIDMSDELQGINNGNSENESDEHDTSVDVVVSDTDQTDVEHAGMDAEEDPYTEPEISEDTATMDGYGMWFKLTNGTYRQVYSIDPEDLKTVAHTLNSYRDVLPEDGNVFYTNVPVTSIGIVLHNTQKYAGWADNFDAGITKHTVDGVHVVNALSVLEEPLLNQEHIYFLSDHHWTPRGAINVVNECMRIQGVPVVPYDEYEYKVNKFVNNEKDTTDDLELMYPLQEVIGHKMPGGMQGDSHRLITYTYKTYEAYLSGDSEIWNRFITGFSTGRKALVIGDSFCRTFAPYLTPYYDEVHKVDARYFEVENNGGTIAELIKKYEIDDVYIVLSYANGVASYTSLVKLEKALNG